MILKTAMQKPLSIWTILCHSLVNEDELDDPENSDAETVVYLDDSVP